MSNSTQVYLLYYELILVLRLKWNLRVLVYSSTVAFSFSKCLTVWVCMYILLSLSGDMHMCSVRVHCLFFFSLTERHVLLGCSPFETPDFYFIIWDLTCILGKIVEWFPVAFSTVSVYSTLFNVNNYTTNDNKQVSNYCYRYMFFFSFLFPMTQTTRELLSL